VQILAATEFLETGVGSVGFPLAHDLFDRALADVLDGCQAEANPAGLNQELQV